LDETGTALQAVPTVCGSLANGMGLGGEAVMIALPWASLEIIEAAPELLRHPSAHRLDSVSLSLDSPPPKA
jgi:hypothetical protein